MRSFAPAFAAALLLHAAPVFASGETPAPQNLTRCGLVESAHSSPGQWTLKNGELKSLHEIHQRISKAANLYPLLVLCEVNQPNAAAVLNEEDGVIFVTTGLVRLVDGNVDELASVVGHEFGHLVHRHGDKKRATFESLANEAARAHGRQVRAGVKRRAAAEKVTHEFVKEFTAFSRIAEREADDEGFSLARRAGYAETGARRLAEKMMKLPGAGKTSYISTHPGWEERLKANTTLEHNEKYRQLAERALAARDLAQLRRIVDQWRERVPGSGAEAYYRGLTTLGANVDPAKLTRAFEEAVVYFRGAGLPQAGQSYQDESAMATIALCASLHRDGRKLEALSCLELLETREQVEAFREITGWREFVLVRLGRSAEAGALFAGRRPDGGIALTNCRHVAEQEGMKAVRAWSPTAETLERRPSAGLLACDPNLCDCRPAEDAATRALQEQAHRHPVMQPLR